MLATVCATIHNELVLHRAIVSGGEINDSDLHSPDNYLPTMETKMPPKIDPDRKSITRFAQWASSRFGR